MKDSIKEIANMVYFIELNKAQRGIRRLVRSRDAWKARALRAEKRIENINLLGDPDDLTYNEAEATGAYVGLAPKKIRIGGDNLA